MFVSVHLNNQIGFSISGGAHEWLRDQQISLANRFTDKFSTKTQRVSYGIDSASDESQLKYGGAYNGNPLVTFNELVRSRIPSIHLHPRPLIYTPYSLGSLRSASWMFSLLSWTLTPIVYPVFLYITRELCVLLSLTR